MYLLIEKGQRGAISYIAKRYSDANNKYMENYDPTKPSKYIEYHDINNLYGWAISYLPYNGFKWLKIFDNFDVNSISECYFIDNSSIRYIVEIDLKYPDKLHALHNDYLLAPEKLPIPYDILSDYCRKIADKYTIKVGGVKKLIPNLSNKTNYVLRHKNLQLYLSLE